jgi:uncharacterized cupin superfamily protein
VQTGSSYPAPFDEPCRARSNQKLALAAGLTQFGVNLTRLPPGAWSSQRHWHAREDELVWVLAGEVALVTDAGEQVMHAGECAAFKAGERDGHHFINRSSADVELLTIGSRDDDDYGEYSDIDMIFRAGRYSGRATFARKDGSSY